ncbi:MAG TPA: TIGR04372 family glycosyltransferase [Urbifossiella sp.]|nr:TIGR04372 family glycosyltransferase [Urbifossiella sp.]
MHPMLFEPECTKVVPSSRATSRAAAGRSAFLSDLTDEQWELLRNRAFAGSPLPEDFRGIVNAARYRERACCPWPLLPAGFPPEQRLREVWNQWQSDNTWSAIRAVLATYEAPRLPQVLPDEPDYRTLRDRLGDWAAGRLLVRQADRLAPVLSTTRRRVARAVRRLPGGSMLLAPGRAAIQAGEYLLSRFTVHARFPAWFRRGHRYVARKEYAKAIRCFTKIIVRDPSAASSYLGRSRAHYSLRNYREACADAQALLAIPSISREERIGTYFLLSEASSLAGDVDRGVEYGYHARWLERQGPAPELEDDAPTMGPDAFELLADVHNDLAELAINANTDFVTAARLYQDGGELRERYLKWLGDAAPRTLFLPEDWVRNIGHIALLEYWVKAKQLRWIDCARIVLLAPPKRTANEAYLRYFRPHMHIVQSDPVSAGIGHFAMSLGRRLACLMPLSDGTTPYLPEAIGTIQEEWERQGRKPLFRLSQADREFGEEQLRAMGVPDGAWYVCFHVRSSGFYSEGAILHQAHRNASIRSYLPAMREVIRRGGWVIRLGDPSMEPLPGMPGAIDYARSKFKSQRMDVFLCATARFFVGVTSGLSHVPNSFGVPCALTNWVSNTLPVYSKNDRFLPKLLLRKRDRKVLTFDEWLSRPVRECSYSGEGLIRDGYTAIDNTPEEIGELVAEVLDASEGNREESAAERTRADRFAELAARHGVRGYARLGTGFLARHAQLLTSAPRFERHYRDAS